MVSGSPDVRLQGFPDVTALLLTTTSLEPDLNRWPAHYERDALAELSYRGVDPRAGRYRPCPGGCWRSALKLPGAIGPGRDATPAFSSSLRYQDSNLEPCAPEAPALPFAPYRIRGAVVPDSNWYPAGCKRHPARYPTAPVPPQRFELHPPEPRSGALPAKPRGIVRGRGGI
jgi:hypothetical protein